MTLESVTKQARNTTPYVEHRPCIEEHVYEAGGASHHGQGLAASRAGQIVASADSAPHHSPFLPTIPPWSSRIFPSQQLETYHTNHPGHARSLY
jgi:hypothetical protein